jgi:alanine racemase
MDMLMIDVLGINCHEGDVVVVFGKTLQWITLLKN